MIKKIIKSIFFFLGYEIKKLDKIKLILMKRTLLIKILSILISVLVVLIYQILLI